MRAFINSVVHSTMQVKLVLLCNFLSAIFLVSGETAGSARAPVPDFFITSAVFLLLTTLLSLAYGVYYRRVKRSEPLHYANLTVLAFKLALACLVCFGVASGLFSR